jgi:hypothetical protein
LIDVARADYFSESLIRLNTKVEDTNKMVTNIEGQSRHWQSGGYAQSQHTDRITLLERETAARASSLSKNNNILVDVQRKLERKGITAAAKTRVCANEQSAAYPQKTNKRCFTSCRRH